MDVLPSMALFLSTLVGVLFGFWLGRYTADKCKGTRGVEYWEDGKTVKKVWMS